MAEKNMDRAERCSHWMFHNCDSRHTSIPRNNRANIKNNVVIQTDADLAWQLQWDCLSQAWPALGPMVIQLSSSLPQGEAE